MRILAIMLSMAVVVALSDGVSGGDKKPTNKEKLVGTWKMTKSTSSDTEPIGSKWDFTKDGKFSYTDKIGNVGVAKGTYEVDGDMVKIKITIVQGEKADKAITVSIKSLTEKELVLEGKKDDKTDTSHFTRTK